MNKCYLIGKVLNEPIFNFFFMDNNVSICYFFIELKNKYKIKVFALDDTADYIYQNIHSNQLVCIEGSLNSNRCKDISVNVNCINIIFNSV